MSDSNDPIAVVHQYVDAFNKGDEKAMAAVCADPMQILDGMSPHVWHGPTASEDFWIDVLRARERIGASGHHVTLGEPWHVDVTGDFSYVVVPASRTVTIKDRQIAQTGSLFTVALRRVGGDWRLTAWAWTKGTL